MLFCGPGNNGGDGVAAARFLLEMGWEVRCVLVGKREKMSADCREMERRLEQSGGKLEDFTDSDPRFAAWSLEADVMVDALFGIGLNTALRGDAATAVADDEHLRRAGGGGGHRQRRGGGHGPGAGRGGERCKDSYLYTA